MTKPRSYVSKRRWKILIARYLAELDAWNADYVPDPNNTACIEGGLWDTPQGKELSGKIATWVETHG